MRVVAVSLFTVVVACGCTVTNDVPSNRGPGGAADSGPTDAGGLVLPTDAPTFDTCPSETFGIEPRDATLLVDAAASPSTLLYAYWFKSCGSTDVSADSTWSVDDSTVGHFESNLFVAAFDATRLGSPTTVHARWGKVESTTPLTVVQYDTGGDRPDVFFGWNGCGASVPSQIVAVDVPAGAPLEVTATPTNDATSTSLLTSLVLRVRAMDEGDASHGCSAIAAIDSDGDGFKDVFPAASGARVCFEVVPATPIAGTPDFLAWGRLQVTGSPGSVAVDTRRVVYRYYRTLAPC